MLTGNMLEHGCPRSTWWHWDAADASVTTWQPWNMACKLTGMCTVPYASAGTQKAHGHASLSIPLEAEGPSK